jgi:hypothetical protein
MSKHFLRNAVFTVCFLIAAVLLTTAIRVSETFALNVYLPFSHTVSGFLGFLFSFTPYAAAEVLLLLAVASAIFCLIRAITRTVRERAARPLLLWLSRAAVYMTGAVFLFFLLWGGNYYTPKLEVRLNLQTGYVEEEVLYLTAERHLDDVIRYAALVSRDAGGAVDEGGFDVLAAEAVRAVKSMVNTPVSPPKRSVFYPVLATLGISGIYIPFTGEAIVNPISTEPFLPAVMAHEMAHRLGFAAEDDANLAAYLICMASDRPVFRYSGALMVYTYCYNAITDPVYRRMLWERLNEEAGEAPGDFSRNREAWARYDGPLRERAEGVNNAYLKTMGQKDGVRSYGRVVDMLIALYLSETVNN